MIDEFLRPHATFLRLLADWKKYGNITIGFDFDQTVCPFHDTNATFDQVVTLLKEMESVGAVLACWTANPDHGYVALYLEKIGIKHAGINVDVINLGWPSRKPFYSILLDDRAGLSSAFHDLTLLLWYIKEHNLANIPQTKLEMSLEEAKTLIHGDSNISASVPSNS